MRILRTVRAGQVDAETLAHLDTVAAAALAHLGAVAAAALAHLGAVTAGALAQLGARQRAAVRTAPTAATCPAGKKVMMLDAVDHEMG